MNALTLTQPWAQLIADGRKRVETRGWRPPATIEFGRIAIHAAKGWTAEDREFAREIGYDPDTLPRGAVIATAVLERCLPSTLMDRRLREREQWEELDYGDYSPGRWAWPLSGIERLPEPIPARGALGLWKWNGP